MSRLAHSLLTTIATTTTSTTSTTSISPMTTTQPSNITPDYAIDFGYK